MNWDQEIEVEGKEGGRVTLTIAELHNLLSTDLQRDDLEEFAEELLALPGHREIVEESWK